MYKIIYIVGFLIRQYGLPNPFTPLGEYAELINIIAGLVYVPLSYFMVGLIYDRGSAPALGSILFTVVYAVNTGVTYLVCWAYPMVWLMIVIGLAYFVLYGFIAYKIQDDII